MTSAAEMARGQRAQAILEDPLVAEAFATLEAECVAEWRRAPARDVEARERLWVMLKLVDRLRAHFESLVADGKLAGQRVAELERRVTIRPRRRRRRVRKSRPRSAGPMRRRKPSANCRARRRRRLPGAKASARS